MSLSHLPISQYMLVAHTSEEHAIHTCILCSVSFSFRQDYTSHLARSAIGFWYLGMVQHWHLVGILECTVTNRQYPAVILECSVSDILLIIWNGPPQTFFWYLEWSVSNILLSVDIWNGLYLKSYWVLIFGMVCIWHLVDNLEWSVSDVLFEC